MRQVLTPVVSCAEVSRDNYLLKLAAPAIAAQACPGQFIMLKCDNGYGRLLRRPLSIHQACTDHVSLLFAVVGPGTAWLAQRQPGDGLDILGPFGNGFHIEPQSRKLLLVAGGMGIAPLCYLASHAVAGGYTVRLLAGARTSCQLYPEQFLPRCEDTFLTTEDGSAGAKGLVTAYLPEMSGWADQVFACGPVPMYRQIHNQYGEYLKDKPVQISLETRMGCGMGFCYACTIKTRKGLQQVCKNGPVFDMRDILWEELE